MSLGSFYWMINILTSSSNMSLWWTWIVMRVSYLVLSTASKSLVVMSIRVLRRSRKNWLVLDMMRRSYRALVRASSESLVQIIWIPSNPTYINVQKTKHIIMVKCTDDLRNLTIVLMKEYYSSLVPHPKIYRENNSPCFQVVNSLDWWKAVKNPEYPSTKYAI